MAITATWNRTLRITSPDLTHNDAGISLITGSQLLAGLGTNNFGIDFFDWYLSKNHGSTWQLLSQTDGDFNQRGQSFAHLPDRITVYSTIEPEFYKTHVWRSADGGATWSNVKTWTGDSTFHAPFSQSGSARSAALSRFYIVGRIVENNGANYGDIAWSNDKGLTWTLGPKIDTNTSIGAGLSIATGTANRVWVGTTRQVIYRSTDGGATWTASAALPVAASTTSIAVYGIAALTDLDLIAGGIGNNLTDGDYAYLWTSSDGGANWSAVDNTDIENWPTGGNSGWWVSTITRLTKRSAIMTGTPGGTFGQTPIWTTIDGGLTWQQLGDFGYGGSDYVSISSRACLDARGKISVIVDHATGGTQFVEIWQATPSC